jgi:FAD/FMN-containing dehydrogenase
MNATKEYFNSILSPDRVSDDPGDLLNFGRDWTRMHKPDPALILFPKTTDEVRHIAAYCYDQGIAIVPSGGRTGLAAAAVAANKEVVVSFDKMNRIIKIDIESGSVDVEAGAVLENIQSSVAETGMYFPLDFAARGSCQIGGCISTNAGGLKVIKYGMTRELVLGLEIVTPTGNILYLNSNLHKNNSGYDLKQYFIGAEGTLGLITKATLKIVPKPKDLQLALLAVDRFQTILEILRKAKLQSLDITAFEFYTGKCMEAVLAHSANARNPLSSKFSFYILIEIDGRNDSQALQSFVESIETMIADGTIAMDTKTFKELWSYRENISETLFKIGQLHKNDIAVPISSMPSFISDLENLIQQKYSEFETFLFGHIGDGNIHVNVVDRNKIPVDDFKNTTDALDMEMGRLIKKYDGSISAEHGIGLLKKKLLYLHRSPEEIQMMKHIKSILDPKNICNPGKIIDL